MTFQHRAREERIEAELLALHEGVLPDTMASQALGCCHVWDPGQQAVRPVLDRFGDTSVPGVAVAGDDGGIDGAAAAELTGRIAALRAAEALGRVDVASRDRRVAPLLQGLARQRRMRPLLETCPTPPRSPHLNGKIERAQRTVLEEFWAAVDSRAPDIADQLSRWVHHYSWHRPHEGLNGLCPIDRVCLRTAQLSRDGRLAN